MRAGEWGRITTGRDQLKDKQAETRNRSEIRHRQTYFCTQHIFLYSNYGGSPTAAPNRTDVSSHGYHHYLQLKQVRSVSRAGSGLRLCSDCAWWPLVTQHSGSLRPAGVGVLPALWVDTTDTVWSNVFAQLHDSTSARSMRDLSQILMFPHAPSQV